MIFHLTFTIFEAAKPNVLQLQAVLKLKAQSHNQCDQIGRFFALVQLFKAFGNNKFAPIFPILTISTLQCS